jgi:hypothetical protein
VQGCANSLYDPDPTVSEVYKQNVGDATDSGSFASSYTTTFSNTPSDPQDALIEWIMGQPSISCPICFLLVKDGNADPAKYAIDISGWNGTEDLVLTGFWPGTGAISHVSIYRGATGGGTPATPQDVVPEPASLLLLGTGLGIVAARMRRKKAKA